MGLHQKMYMVMVDSESIEKSLTVGEGKNSYKAVGEAAVLNVIKPLLKKHGLVIFPVGVEIKEDFQEFAGKYGTSQRFLSTLHSKYKIVDIDSGEFEILETVGYGVDSQDKASGKAMTYAYKVMLQKTFCLFSGEDTDNEHSEDISKKNSFEPKPQKPAPKQDWKESLNIPAEWQDKVVDIKEEVKLITIPQAKRLFAIAKGNEQMLRGIIESFGYASSKEIKLSDYDAIVKKIENRGK